MVNTWRLAVSARPGRPLWGHTAVLALRRAIPYLLHIILSSQVFFYQFCHIYAPTANLADLPRSSSLQATTAGVSVHRVVFSISPGRSHAGHSRFLLRR